MFRIAAVTVLLATLAAGQPLESQLRTRAERYDRVMESADRLMRAWLKSADPQTMLLPDRVNNVQRVYTPHNSGADLYPYLILTARMTDPALYRGRMMEMLRNEIRYTSHPDGVPGNFDLVSRKLGPPSMFGAGEYAKDGLVTVTEALGRTPWFTRMADMTAAAMRRAAVKSDFGMLPARDAELNGDYLQVLVRLAAMNNDTEALAWARRIGDAYVREVLPGNSGLPSMDWDFDKHTGDGKLKLRDHGNEIVVGLVMLYCLERDLETERFMKYRPILAGMLDRILASANPDGMLYNVIDPKTLKPIDERLSDNWGYIYGAVYAFYQATGEAKYRDAVLKVLKNLPKYRNHAWEPSGNAADKSKGSFDGYADAIESAIYLVNREPVAEAVDWIDSEMRVMQAMQRPDGHVEDWYGEGNFNRTSLLYALMQSQGVWADGWRKGVGIGAVREGDGLTLYVSGAARVKFDYERHRRVMNFRRNYVRLNEFPEWFTVEENRVYRVSRADGSGQFERLGAELAEGIDLQPGQWRVEPAK
ncbi:MAG: hypothetical protein C0504_07400 [Candidatus Solibacter sp.]|nr:hypothetical protein [Candidatus Solibacter sp.]